MHLVSECLRLYGCTRTITFSKGGALHALRQGFGSILPALALSRQHRQQHRGPQTPDPTRVHRRLFVLSEEARNIRFHFHRFHPLSPPPPDTPTFSPTKFARLGVARSRTPLACISFLAPSGNRLFVLRPLDSTRRPPATCAPSPRLDHVSKRAGCAEAVGSSAGCRVCHAVALECICLPNYAALKKKARPHKPAAFSGAFFAWLGPTTSATAGCRHKTTFSCLLPRPESSGVCVCVCMLG